MGRTAPEVALLVKRLQHTHHRALSAALADLGVSLVQWDTLRHLDQHPGASLHELAQLTFQTDQSFGSLAARMVDRGLLERLPGPGRVVRHRLTELGERLRREGQGRAERVFVETFAPLGQAQLDLLGDLLEALVAARV
ncbi:MarR family transcriptional regulator [Actinoplanes sp. NPDC049548]|uniref:MarR family winged helix-turn-helix transcriptional regulator n=1 Tax=Actinoplanes sp. NPDC049548 TaxID=3155152 RepID=UPI003444E793